MGFMFLTLFGISRVCYARYRQNDKKK
ncbi:hypothetical protein KKC1_31990, partial [Calderihabitans maritimus]